MKFLKAYSKRNPIGTSGSACSNARWGVTLSYWRQNNIYILHYLHTKLFLQGVDGLVKKLMMYESGNWWTAYCSAQSSQRRNFQLIRLAAVCS
jgi:hypothetical protein